LNVKDDPVEMCIYWLSKEYFVTKNEEVLDFQPVGLHVKDMLITSEQMEILNNCTAKASVLDRLSSLALAYYITVGMISGISTMAGECKNGNWSFLTGAFLWSIPVIVRRTFGTGILVVKDPRIELNGHLIRVLEENDDIRAIENEMVERGENPAIRRFDRCYRKPKFICTSLFSVILHGLL